MKQFFTTFAAVAAAILLFFVGVPVVLIALAAGAAKPAAVPANAVLVLDLRPGLSDQPPADPLAAFSGPSLSVSTVRDALTRARSDNRIKALLVRLPETGLAPAAADELRQAFDRFRAAGKPVFAHSQGLYAAGVVVSTYMLGAAADELWMQPGSTFQVTGMASEDVFFRRFFERYGVKAEFEQRDEYKNAVNPYLQSDYTPAHREAQLSWMTSIYTHALESAAALRKTTPDALRAAIEAGPYAADEALRMRLIDKVGHVKEIEAAARERAGAGAQLIDYYDYAARPIRAPSPSRAPVIATIEGEGAIVTGYSANSPLFSSEQMIYSDDMSRALYAAAEDKDVKAVVLRLSSPGGSDTASEQILAAVRAVKAAGKPIVVSMGTYAASGGYWVSSQASAIVAQPGTLTGSIGVYGGKFALGDALARFGVDVRQTAVGGEFAGAYAAGSGFTPAQRAAFARQVDAVYEGFIARVAEGRGMPADKVREIAKGRVWTGAQAKDIGLVDEIGGFEEAVVQAKVLAGLKPDDAVRLRPMRSRASPFEALERLMGVSEAAVRVMSVASLAAGDREVRAVLRDLSEARLRAEGAVVLAPTPLD